MAPAFERTPPARGPLVQGFSGRGFRIDGEVYEGVILTPERALAWDAPALAGITPETVEPALAADPEFLLLGTGAVQDFPPRAFVAALEELGIGVDAMDSRAAARAWGLLRGEGRWIAAALLPL